MTLTERLRALAAQEERDVAAGFEGCSIEHVKAEREAADALDAKDARIKELDNELERQEERFAEVAAKLERAREALK